MSGVHGSQQQIDAYLDGELGDSEQASLLAHCDICETCRALLESRRAFLETIRAARPRMNAPAGLRDKVTALLETEGSTRKGPSS
ncbi:MAG: zf-HC2 domain-containing protein, partial [Acidobacteriaceae bacterium]|nr:zf-HC2 domain-containing protein [Acidobacteriaceae bacterium]